MSEWDQDPDRVARVVGALNTVCAECGRIVRIEVMRSPLTGQSGVIFKCHGETDFMPISDSMANVPRFAGKYRPFGNRIVQGTEGFRPKCSFCKTLVNQQTVTENKLADSYSITSNCHGKRERIVLLRQAILNYSLRQFLSTYTPFSVNGEPRNCEITGLETMRDSTGAYLGWVFITKPGEAEVRQVAPNLVTPIVAGEETVTFTKEERERLDRILRTANQIQEEDGNDGEFVTIATAGNSATPWATAGNSTSPWFRTPPPPLPSKPEREAPMAPPPGERLIDLEDG